MSLEIDWPAIRNFLAAKLRSTIESVPMDVDPMLRSTIKVTHLSLGDSPPHLALSHIITLRLDNQTVGVVAHYDGNAELEIQLDLDRNAVANKPEALEVNRFMGTVYTECPMVTRCRLLFSGFRISVKVEISRGAQTFIRFEEPPAFSICIDSHLSHLGPIFESSMQRIVRFGNQEFAQLPERIEIPL
jgi:hypothetical protein